MLLPVGALCTAAFLAAAPLAAAPARTVELTRAVVVVHPRATPLERQACRLLVEEAARRSGVRLRVSATPRAGAPAIALGSAPRLPSVAASRAARPPAASEAYALRVLRASSPALVAAIGRDQRGCMFAAGRLLREIRWSRGRLRLPLLRIATAPARPVRGHQIGWRAKSNTYDRWGLAHFEQYVRDLVVWGTNAIELIPNDGDTDAGRGERMTIAMADVAASYGMCVWLWYPLDDRVPSGVTGDGLEPGRPPCPSRADGRRAILASRRRLFGRMRHLDAVFIPGGDPAGCPCPLCRPWVSTLLPLAADIARELRATHPNAGLWLSNQGFTAPDNAILYRALKARPTWLAGLVHGPWAEQSIAQMRRETPESYPVREYPDITHCVRCQYPVPAWDPAFGQTLGREPPIYRPTEDAHIARLNQARTCGAISYSDGVNDDLSKVVWSAMLWDPRTPVREVLAGYCRYHLWPADTMAAVDGILGLERDWHGPLASSTAVPATYARWRALERAAPLTLRGNWRFQMALLRACYDRYVQRKLAADRLAQARALRQLAGALPRDPLRAARDAADSLERSMEATVAPDLRARMLALGQALYDCIGMQLSVKRWGASGAERGAILDALGTPMADQRWLSERLRALAARGDPAGCRAGVARLLHWEDPGPGGWYDDLGDPARQAHLVRLARWEDDPGYLRGTRCDCAMPVGTERQSWLTYAEALYDSPIVMRYRGLDPRARYAVRATYAGRYRPTMTLTAGARWPVHGPVATQRPPVTTEWPVPRGSYHDGTLTLTWRRVSGRGAQVSEVWLLRR
ncbi:MAG: hypothetical protein IT208_00630 [Chthonomonadales bacterium]|nr:hypothetical protein [Chthonomonadales bacterium]